MKILALGVGGNYLILSSCHCAEGLEGGRAKRENNSLWCEWFGETERKSVSRAAGRADEKFGSDFLCWLDGIAPVREILDAAGENSSVVHPGDDPLDPRSNCSRPDCPICPRVPINPKTNKPYRLGNKILVSASLEKNLKYTELQRLYKIAKYAELVRLVMEASNAAAASSATSTSTDDELWEEETNYYLKLSG